MYTLILRGSNYPRVPLTNEAGLALTWLYFTVARRILNDLLLDRRIYNHPHQRTHSQALRLHRAAEIGTEYMDGHGAF